MDAARFYRSMWDLDTANQSIAQQAAANRAAAAPQSQYQMPFSPNPPMTGVQMAQRDLPGALDVGKQINDYMLNYQRSGIPNYGGNEQALSNRITALLNPNDPTASYDVAMHGAEGAAGLGVAPGSSGLGAQLTGRLREADIERRAALGANLMGQEVSWLPKPFDPSRLLVDPTTVYTTQEQEAMERLRLGQQLSIEQARLLNDIMARQGYRGGGGGGYGYDPTYGTTRHTPAPVAAAGGGGASPLDYPIQHGSGYGYASSYNPSTDPFLMSDAAAFQQEFGTPYLNYDQGPMVDVPEFTPFDEQSLYA